MRLQDPGAYSPIDDKPDHDTEELAKNIIGYLKQWNNVSKIIFNASQEGTKKEFVAGLEKIIDDWKEGK